MSTSKLLLWTLCPITISCKFHVCERNLEERDKLSERVRNLETIVAEKDEELKVLHRRLQLDAKGFKQQINSGINKQKELMLKLDKANSEILRIGEIIRTEVE